MHLMELRFAHCQIKPEVMTQLTCMLNQRSYLSHLSLVQVPLSDKKAQDALCEYISDSKHLRKLDLSYNQFTKDYLFSQRLLKTISRNKYLQDINLSYNNFFTLT